MLVERNDHYDKQGLVGADDQQLNELEEDEELQQQIRDLWRQNRIEVEMEKIRIAKEHELAEYERQLKQGPPRKDYFKEHLEWIDSLIDEGKYGEAIQELSTNKEVYARGVLISHRPEVVDRILKVYSWQAYDLLKRQEYEQVISVFNSFRRKHQELVFPYLYFAAARAYRLTNRLYEAGRVIEEVVRAVPNNPDYLAELAAIRRRNGT